MLSLSNPAVPPCPQRARSAHSTRLRALVLSTSVAALSVVAPTPATAAASGATASPAARYGYSGHAFGTYVSVGGVVKSGPSAVVALGCGPPAGFRARNSAATVTLGNTLSASTLATTESTGDSPTRTATTARAQNANVLGGLVTASAVKAVSITTHDAAGYATDAAGSTFTNLRVLGVPIIGTPAPNTTMQLPGVGRVVLNEQRSTVGTSSAKLTVYAIHAFVTQANALGLPVGTTAVVAGAVSAITDPTGGFLNGFAYGTNARVGDLISSGPSFRAYMPCGGTNGMLRSNTGAGISVPAVITSGTITDTARGSQTATTAHAETTSTLTSVNLLNGYITATGVKADAHAARINGKTTLSAAGSRLASIRVNGRALDVSTIEANTTMRLAGVGTLYLSRRIATSTSLEIRMIELILTPGNSLGLPAGTDIRAAVASVGAR